MVGIILIALIGLIWSRHIVRRMRISLRFPNICFMCHDLATEEHVVHRFGFICPNCMKSHQESSKNVDFSRPILKLDPPMIGILRNFQMFAHYNPKNGDMTLSYITEDNCELAIIHEDFHRQLHKMSLEDGDIGPVMLACMQWDNIGYPIDRHLFGHDTWGNRNIDHILREEVWDTTGTTETPEPDNDTWET